MVVQLFESDSIGKKILDCFALFTGTSPDKVESIVPAGSNRIYYRLFYSDESVIAAYSDNNEETSSFLYFTELFKKLEYNVPEIYFVSDDQMVYFLEDLGSVSLFDIVQSDQKKGEISKKTISLYKKSISELVKVQIGSAAYVDYSKCYQISEFGKESILYDLNYFKYYFLKISGLDFDENLLQKDFESISSLLATTGDKFFMLRDFQSRNIMVKDQKPYFIDYQGGRKGAIQYDLASLLYQAKARLPEKVKSELLKYYIKLVKSYIPIDDKEFETQFYMYVLVRVLQTLGAYGLRGLIEKKAHFIESIPFALKNVENILSKVDFVDNYPELKNVLTQLAYTKKFDKTVYPEFTITVTSFSFKKGYPEDKSGNGGGFVFDCRGIHNPGRYAEYKEITGRDDAVIKFFKDNTDIDDYVVNVLRTVKPTIENYIERGFNSLNISFGCTGGQHRSVYCAENIAHFIRKQYKVTVNLNHRELGIIES